MAETVTISTFLELKDNMSAGLKKVEAALTQLNKAKQSGQRAADAAARKSEREQQKAAQQAERDRARAIKAEEDRQRRLNRIARNSYAQDDRLRAKQMQGVKFDALARARAMERIAKQAKRTESQIAKARLGPTFDPAARSKAAFAEQARVAGARLGPTFDPAARSREIDRQAQVQARAVERIEKRRIDAERRVATEQDRLARRNVKEQERLMRRTAATRQRTSGAGLSSVRGGASALGGAVGSAAGMALGYVSVKRMFDVLQDFEQQTFRIAGTLKAFSIAPTFDAAMYSAKGLYSTLRDMAAKLPGETEDYLQVFSTALPKAIESGLTDVRKIADFTSRYAAVALSNQVDAAQAGRDLFLMLAGRAKSDVKMFTVLSGHIKLATKDFNQLSAAARRSKIDEAIRKYDDQIAAAGGTFNAKVGETLSRLKEILVLGSEPLFETAKEALTTINTYLKENKDIIVNSVKVIAIDLSAALKDAMRSFNRINEIIEDIAFWSKAAIAVWIGAKTVSGLLAVYEVFSDIKNVFAAISNTAAFKFLANLDLTGLGRMATRFAGAAAFLMPSDTADATLKGGSDQFKLFRNIQEQQTREYADLETSGARAALDRMMGMSMGATEFGKLLDPSSPSKFADIANVNKLGELYKKAASSNLAAPEGAITAAQVLKYAKMLGVDPTEVATTGGFVQGAGVGAGLARTARGAPKGRQTTINDFRFSKFDIRQEFAKGFDPDRIAVAFASDLARLGEMKMQSAYAPLFAVRGGG